MRREKGGRQKSFKGGEVGFVIEVELCVMSSMCKEELEGFIVVREEEGGSNVDMEEEEEVSVKTDGEGQFVLQVVKKNENDTDGRCESREHYEFFLSMFMGVVRKMQRKEAT